MNVWLALALVAAGYVAAVFTWDYVHTFIIGAEAKVKSLIEQARSLEQKVKE